MRYHKIGTRFLVNNISVCPTCGQVIKSKSKKPLEITIINWTMLRDIRKPENNRTDYQIEANDIKQLAEIFPMFDVRSSNLEWSISAKTFTEKMKELNAKMIKPKNKTSAIAAE